jgi:hypothetical protein
VRDVFDHCEELNLRDFRMLRTGRHFRVAPRTKLIVGRDEAENNLLEKHVQSGEATVRWLDGAGPIGVLLGCVDEVGLEIASKIVLRYTRSEKEGDCPVKVVIDGNERFLRIANTYDDRDIEMYRI